MAADRTELDDQAGKNPEIVTAMSAAYEAWQQRCKADDNRSASESLGDKAKPPKGSRSAKGPKQSPPKPPEAE
jgi:hypothetical protein